MRYDHETYNMARLMFIEQSKSPADISRELGGKPSKNTVMNWSQAKDEQGKTWRDYRADFRIQQYERLSPNAQAQKILLRIDQILQKPEFNTKDADALAKMQKTLEKVVNKKYQIPVMFQMLTDLINFIQRHYPHLISEELFAAIKHFKNHLRKRLEVGS